MPFEIFGAIFHKNRTNKFKVGNFMLNPMVLKFFYPIKLTTVMGRIHQSKHGWQLSRRFEIKSDHSSIRFDGDPASGNAL